MVTLAQVAAAVAELERVHNTWETVAATHMQALANDSALAMDETILRRWWDAGRELVHRILTPALMQTMDALFDLVNTDQIERDAWELVERIDGWEELWVKWKERNAMRPDSEPPDGGTQVWTWYTDRLIPARRTPREKRLPEPLRQLLAKNPPEHVAKIYGWYMSDGRPDVTKVFEEEHEPGKHYNPETWESRSDRRYWEQREAWWKTRCERRRQWTGFGQALNPKATPKEWRAPQETLEDLIFNGVNAQQISKMWRISVEDVYAKAAELGVALDAGALAPANFMQTQRQRLAREQENLQRTMDASRIENYPELGSDREGRILRMSEDGHKSKIIAEALRREFPGITPATVGNIVANARKKTASS